MWEKRDTLGNRNLDDLLSRNSVRESEKLCRFSSFSSPLKSIVTMPFFNAVTQQQQHLEREALGLYPLWVYFLNGPILSSSCFRSPLLSDLITEEIMAFVDINTNLNNIPNENKRGNICSAGCGPFFFPLRDCCRIRKKCTAGIAIRKYIEGIYTQATAVYPLWRWALNLAWAHITQHQSTYRIWLDSHFKLVHIRLSLWPLQFPLKFRNCLQRCLYSGRNFEYVTNTLGSTSYYIYWLGVSFFLYRRNWQNTNQWKWNDGAQTPRLPPTKWWNFFFPFYSMHIQLYIVESVAV